jgi:hypothetical protein
MFSKHIDKINSLPSSVKQDSQGQGDSIAIISRHMGRTTQTAVTKGRTPGYLVTRYSIPTLLLDSSEEASFCLLISLMTH